MVEKPPANLAYTKGVVAMAKTSAEPPGTSGSQFYVVTGADAGLPPEYALVGKVSEGMDVVERIGKPGNRTGRKTETDRPDRIGHDREGLAARGWAEPVAKLDVGDPAPDFELPGTGEQDLPARPTTAAAS